LVDLSLGTILAQMLNFFILVWLLARFAYKPLLAMMTERKERIAKDLEALQAEHVAKGYDVTELKGLPGHPANYYFVKDLDGYKIEVIREK